MEINKTSEVILKSNPAAVYISYSKDPSIKDVLQSIKTSPQFVVLEESNNHIIIAKKSSPYYSTASRRRHRKFYSCPRRVKLIHRRKQKESFMNQMLSALGITASPIRTSKQTDTSNIVNASGILF